MEIKVYTSTENTFSKDIEKCRDDSAKNAQTRNMDG